MRRQYSAPNQIARYIGSIADQIGLRARPAYATAGMETQRADCTERSIFDYVFFSKDNGNNRQRHSGRIRVEGERGKTIHIPVKDIPQDPETAESFLRSAYNLSAKVARGIVKRL